jgi:putative ABC transport system permease protein
MAGSLAKLRLAWRDLWAQGRRSVFFALLVAAGVASLVGVQGMARSMEASMHDQAKQMFQGDVIITTNQPLTEKQKEAVHALEHDGAKLTETVESVGHAETDSGHSMLEVKVIDPKVWPFYGGLVTSPEGVRPGKGEAVVAEELLHTLKLQVGDTLSFGEAHTVKVVGTVLEEPRPIGQVPYGQRVFVSSESFGDAFPSGTHNFLLKLPAGMTVDDAKARLLTVFPEDALRTSVDAWKAYAAIMDKVFTFLSMIALTSLLVGGLGVAMAMRTFISQKLEHIAVLKSLGATSGTVMSVFLAEAAMLGLGGSLAGALLGMGVQVWLPRLFEGLVPVPALALDLTSALSGLAAGVAIALLSALIPVRAIRAIKPVALFRGESGGAKLGWKARAEALLLVLLTLVGIAWMAIVYAKSAMVGLGFLAGLIAAALVLFLLSWVLLRVLRLLPQSGFPAIRHAIRSLHAPGNQAASVVVAMGLGIMLITTVYLLQNGLLAQIKTVGIGSNTPNIYVMSQKPENREQLIQTLESHKEVRKVLDTTLAVNAQVVSVDGKSPADLAVEGGDAPVMVTGSPVDLPKGYKVVEGEWFTPADKGRQKLTVLDRFARTYSMQIGSTVVLKIKEETVPFTVTSIYMSSDEGGMNMELANMSSAPATIDAYADNYMVTAITKPHKEEAVMGDLLKAHPDAMPISLAAYIEEIEKLLTRVANILRFVTAFAVVAAGVILSGSLSATRFRRRKEGALLKSLGASRLTVATASGLENGLLGAVSGLVGGALAYTMVSVVAMGLKMAMGLSLAPLTAAAVAGGVMAVLVGVGSTLDVLQVKPLSVLRSE